VVRYSRQPELVKSGVLWSPSSIGTLKGALQTSRVFLPSTQSSARELAKGQGERSPSPLSALEGPELESLDKDIGF